MSGPDRVWALIQLNRWDEAAELAVQLLAEDPDDTALHVAHAHALLPSDAKAAVAAAERAVALGPDDPRALAALARSRLVNGDLRKALAATESLRTQAPHWAESHLLHSRVLLKQAGGQAFPHKGTLDKARGSARWVVRNFPDAPAGHLQLAEIDLAARDHDSARRHATTALGIDPNNATAHEILGLIAEQKGEYQTASRHYVAVGHEDAATGVSRLRGLGKAGPAVGLVGGIGIYVVARAVLRLSIDGGDYRWLVLVGTVVALALIGLREYRARLVDSAMTDSARAIREADASFAASSWRQRAWWSTGNRATIARAALGVLVIAVGAVLFTVVPAGDDEGAVAATTVTPEREATNDVVEQFTSEDYRNPISLGPGDCLLEPADGIDYPGLMRTGPCDQPTFGTFVVRGFDVDDDSCTAATTERYGAGFEPYLLNFSELGMGSTCFATSPTPVVWTDVGG